MNDITVSNKINFMHDVVIYGNGHTVTASAGATWTGLYVFQFYQVNATVKDITLTGEDAGMLVNGSNVTLEGTVDVSGNKFGGIEVSKGTDVVNNGSLVVNADLTNTTEDFSRPTIWVEKGQGSVTDTNGQLRNETAVGKNQELYFINEITPQEEMVKGKFFNAFAVAAGKGITAKVDLAALTVEITKTGVDLTEEELVDYFVKLMMSETNTASYTILSYGTIIFGDADITTEEQLKAD